MPELDVPEPPDTEEMQPTEAPMPQTQAEQRTAVRVVAGAGGNDARD